jgi:chloramphenicol-sensitive protein RarD
MGAENDGAQRGGFWYGVTAYGMWGLFPLYWPLLKPSGAVEILCHRMVWSLVAVVVILAVLRRWAWIPVLLRQPRRLALIAAAACVISVNWGLYIWGVNTGHVVETSLGYFINPLVTIGFGVLLLHERLRPAQWVAVGIGAAAVLVLTIGYGRLPWIALALAFSFGTYGLIKKKVSLGGIESLAAETAVQFVPASGYLLVICVRGDGTFGTISAGHSLLLACCGVVTAVPLVFFGMAAVRIPLSVIGLLQYLAPVFQFALGVAYFHEAMPAERWAGFALVWAALTLLTWDALRNAALARRRAAAARAGLPQQSTPHSTDPRSAGPSTAAPHGPAPHGTDPHGTGPHGTDREPTPTA